jgi:hypothetical protein
MYLNVTYSKVHIGKNQSDEFHVQNNLKKGHALLSFLFNFVVECDSSKVQDNQED